MPIDARESSDRGLGVPFLGYSVGSVLFGITTLQAYQYFISYPKDSRLRKGFVTFICVLDLSHLILGAALLYTVIISFGCEPNPEEKAINIFKVFSTVQVLHLSVLTKSARNSSFAFVPSLRWSCPCRPSIRIRYGDVGLNRERDATHAERHEIVSGNLYLNRAFSCIVKAILLSIVTYEIAVGAVFLFHVERVHSLHTFSSTEKRVIFLGLGSTAFIDSILGTIMAIVLFHSRPKSGRLLDVIKFLVVFFVGTGLLTALAPLLLLVLYATQPNTMLYVSVEFSITRLYANSILALFNSKKRFHEKMQDPIEPELVASAILFGEMHGSQV